MKLLDIQISELTKEETALKIKEFLASEKKHAVYKINTEFLLRALHDKEFFHTLNSSDINIADGRGVLWAAKYLSLPITKSKVFRPVQAVWQMIKSGAAIVLKPGYITSPIAENIPGVEAMRMMLKASAEAGGGVFFFGATAEDLTEAIKIIQRENPVLSIKGSLDGYAFQENKGIDPVETINKSGAKLLIVALGSPLQEQWIKENLPKLHNVRVAVGEGGSLAKLAGSQKISPKWVSKVGLEWLWRLFMNKSMTHQTGGRLRRVWNAVPVFIYEMVKYKIKKEYDGKEKN